MDTLAYLRVSDPRQATADKASLPAQREALNALAGRLGRTVGTEGWFEEPGFSAGTADRPAFQRLLAFCEANPRSLGDGLILIYKDDRLGRFDDPEESAYWRVHLRMRGWVVRFALNDDTSDPMARGVLRAIGAAQASLERQAIRQRARMGVRGAAAKGFWCNREPFGYRRLAVDPLTGVGRQLEPGQRKGPNEQLKLTPGPDAEVRFVQWLFASYASGRVSLAELTRQSPSVFPKPWIRRTLHQMLLNPAYAGDTVWARRATDDLANPVVARDTHPALVDRATVTAVQAMLLRNRRETSPTPGGYPLSGLLTCAQCGNHFVGGGGRRLDEEPLRFYKDAGYHKQPRCPGRMMTFLRRDIEPQVIEAIAKVIDKENLEPLIRAAFDRLLMAGEGDIEEQREGLARQRATDGTRLERVLAAIADGTVTPAEARQQLAAIRKRIEDAGMALERLKFDERRLERLEVERDRLTALALDFRTQAKRMEGRELRELLRPWLASAVVDKERMTLTLEIRRMPTDSLFTSARPDEQQETVRRVLRLKTRSDWARLREAAKRARRAS
jgi:DNA invertase Pin-like site-specific DNA recombinase